MAAGRASPEERRARLERGRRAEDAAAAFVVGAGMALIGRNVRVGRLELDLVAREGDAIVIVEVRTRGDGSWVGPLGSIDWRKQGRVRAAGEALWRSRFRHDARVQRMRFDVIAVELGEPPRIEHVRAAF